MLTMLNARERSAEEWDSLIQGADPGLKLSRIIQPPLASQGIIEIVLRDVTSLDQGPRL